MVEWSQMWKWLLLSLEKNTLTTGSIIVEVWQTFCDKQLMLILENDYGDQLKFLLEY